MKSKLIRIMEVEEKLKDIVVDGDLDLYSTFTEDCDVNININENCKLNFFATYFGKISININIILEKNSEVKHTEVFVGKKDDNFQVNLNIVHKGESSKGDVLVKGILLDNSKSINYGKLIIEKGAKKTSTFLAEHVLLLSKDAKANAVPSLEIEEDDVIAKHSASITQIDESKLFYLTSKGIDEDLAKSMIINGFFGDCFFRIENDELREKYKTLVLGRWIK